MGLEVRDLYKSFGETPALRGIDLHVASGSLVALLGPSGSGKTTLLRVIAGLEVPDAGQVLIAGEEQTRRSPRERNIGLVFQHYALFNHLSVFENVAFGLRVRRRPKAEVEERVRELLGFIQLEGYEARRPGQLSGGQRQRVALARALAVQPRLLLLDEPFGALDAKVRQELRAWLRRLHDELHITSLFVTHDQDEAFEVADRVVVMNNGAIEQAGAPEELFESPTNMFVADFVGDANVLQGCARCGRAVFGALDIPYPEYQDEQPLAATAYLRSHDLELRRTRNGGGELPVRIVQARRTGSTVKLVLVALPCLSTLHLDMRPEEWRRLELQPEDTAYLAVHRASVFTRRPGSEEAFDSWTSSGL